MLGLVVLAAALAVGQGALEGKVAWDVSLEDCYFTEGVGVVAGEVLYGGMMRSDSSEYRQGFCAGGVDAATGAAVWKGKYQGREELKDAMYVNGVAISEGERTVALTGRASPYPPLVNNSQELGLAQTVVLGRDGTKWVNTWEEAAGPDGKHVYPTAFEVQYEGEVVVVYGGKKTQGGALTIVVRGLRRESGAEVWRAEYATGETDATAVTMGRAVVVSGGTVYTLSHDTVVALSVSTGAQLWVRKGVPVTALVMHPEGKALYATTARGTTLLEAATGRTLWQVTGVGGLHALVDRTGALWATGPTVASNAQDWDARTVKISAEGKVLVDKKYDNGRMDSARALAMDGEGNVYVGMQSYSPKGLFRVWSPDLAVVKYSSAGEQVWVARVEGGDSATGVTVAADGAVYAAGWGRLVKLTQVEKKKTCPWWQWWC